MKYILSFVVLLFTCTFSAEAQVLKKLIGKWEGTDDKKEVGSVEFVDSIHVILLNEGQRALTGTYRVDTTKKPMWLDITLKDEKKSMTLKTLFLFLDNNRFKWQPFFDGNRPNKFVKETADNTMILTRVNP